MPSSRHKPLEEKLSIVDLIDTPSLLAWHFIADSVRGSHPRRLLKLARRLTIDSIGIVPDSISSRSFSSFLQAIFPFAAADILPRQLKEQALAVLRGRSKVLPHHLQVCDRIAYVIKLLVSSVALSYRWRSIASF